MIPLKTLASVVREQERLINNLNPINPANTNISEKITTGELSNLINSIGVGVKLISHLVATAGFKGLDGYSGKMNVQHELTRILDDQADEVLVQILGSSGHFGLIVSEERDTVVETDDFSQDAKYVVAFDPLDGSSNIGSNIPVGTIFTIFKKLDSQRSATKEDFLQTGENIVAAGYSIYGAKTSFVYTTGHGVKGFTLDPTIGEFVLTEDNIRIPSSGSIYSVNESYSYYWHSDIRKFIDYLKTPPNFRDKSVLAEGNAKTESQDALLSKIVNTEFTARYVGSLVSDFDRTIRKGGIFLYPASSKHPVGRLRLLYEVMPLAFIMKNAGGSTITSSYEGINKNEDLDVLKINPKDIHQRSSMVAGGESEILLFKQMVKG